MTLWTSNQRFEGTFQLSVFVIFHFTELAHWADSVLESRCLFAGMFVCPLWRRHPLAFERSSPQVTRPEPRPLIGPPLHTPWEGPYRPLRVTCHISCVTCHVSHVMCHVSQVTCHVSNVPCHFFFFFSFSFFLSLFSVSDSEILISCREHSWTPSHFFQSWHYFVQICSHRK